MSVTRVTEFRIALPLTVAEFGLGQLYMNAKAGLEASTGDEGVEWIENRAYDNRDGHMGTCAITGTVVPRNAGQYTLKRYHFKSKIPSVLGALAPSNALFLTECAWNSYPHCKTVLVNGYLSRDTLRIDVESLHVGGDGACGLENALNLTPEELKMRRIEVLDIRAAHSDPAAKGYRAEHDMSKWRSTKTGRGPLQVGWESALKGQAPVVQGIGASAAGEAQASTPAVGATLEGGDASVSSGAAPAPSHTPVMCCYKVVRTSVHIFGLAGTVEGAIVGQQRGLFASSLCHAVATLDEWADITPEQLRALEEEVARAANAKLSKTVAAAPPIARKK